MIMSNPSALSLYDFSKGKSSSTWSIVDDGVMGGMSRGNFYVNEEGNGVFEGYVSLENYGGFSSVRHRFPTRKVEQYSTIKIRLKGDGKRYQFRVKSDRGDRHSYIYYFMTNGEWQDVEIPMNAMVPMFRGRKMNMVNYPGDVMEEVAILIANKKAENFRLEIDRITLE